MSIARRIALFCLIFAGIGATGCTPEQVEAFLTLTPEQQSSIIAARQRPKAPTGGGDCYSAIDKHWPASSAGWAKGIVKRESGGNPSAKNGSSSASGCFQLLSMHGHRIPGGWGARFNAEANVLGALSLYREAGTSPWKL